MAVATFAAANLEDVAVAGDASVSPSGATLLRSGTASTFSLDVTASEGNISSGNCDGTKNKVTIPTSYEITATGLTTSGSTSLTFSCTGGRNFTQSPETITFTNLSLQAGIGAPLGYVSREIDFATVATFGQQVVLGDEWSDPIVYATVNPRPASGFSATAASTSQIDLAWSASADAADITGYAIEQTGGASATLSAAASATTLNVAGLDASTEYCFRILARYTDSTPTNFDSTWAPASGTVCATTLTPTPTSDLSIAGFKSPVDMGITNLAKGGQTIPLKFEIFDGLTEIENDTSIVSVFTAKAPCGSTPEETDAIENYTTGSTSLRWDATSGQYIFNWKTPKVTATECWRVSLTVDDGASSDTIFADFSVRK